MRDVNMLLTATDPDEEAIYTLMTILILTCPLEKEWSLVNVAFSRSLDFFGPAVTSTSPFEIKVSARAQCVTIKPLALHQCTSLHRRERETFRAQLQLKKGIMGNVVLIS